MQSSDELPSRPLAQPGLPCQFALPGADDSVPEWVGTRPDAPFNVSECYARWKQMYDAEAECLYLTALAEFTPAIAALAPESQGGGQTSRQAANLKRVIELAPTDSYSVQNFDEVKSRQLLNDLRSALEMIDQAQRHPHCVFDAGMILSDKVNKQPPHLAAFRSASRIILMEMRLHFLRAEFVSVERGMKRILRMSRDVRPRGAFVHHLIAVALEKMVIEVINAEILTRRDLTADQFRRFLVILEQHEAACIDSTVEMVFAEYIMTANALWGLEHDTTTFEDVGFEAVTPVIAKAVNYELEWEELNKLYAFLLHDFLIEPYDSVLKQSRYKARMEKMRDEAKAIDADAFRRSNKLPHSILIVMLAPAIDDFREVMARMQVRIGGIRSLLRIRIFELENNRLPESLEEVFEAGADSLPIDPYSGGHLNYRVMNNMVRVYSTGNDQKDDNAEEEWDFIHSSGDFILQMPVLKHR